MALSCLKLPLQLRSNFKSCLRISTSRAYSFNSHNRPTTFLSPSSSTNVLRRAGVAGRLCDFWRQYSSDEEKSLLTACPTEFVDILKKHNISRCYFVWDESVKKVVGSHPELKEIEDWLNDAENGYYKQHEAVFLAVGMRSNCLLGAFLWNVNRGQAVSATFVHISLEYIMLSIQFKYLYFWREKGKIRLIQLLKIY